MTYQDIIQILLKRQQSLKTKNNNVNSTQKSDEDRTYFGQPAYTVNAWYMPYFNSITLPLGILQQPYYDINYPASVKYGAIGVVAGHEVTHGFGEKYINLET